MPINVTMVAIDNKYKINLMIEDRLAKLWKQISDSKIY